MSKKSKTGVYSVNGVHYANKILAMQACPDGYYPTWEFLNDIGNFNWSQEPNGTLLDWYRLRAEQIRNKYDRVLLLFSGGIDSITMLRSFVDNGIPFEGVASYGSFSLPNHEKYLRNQEVLHMAIPYVQQLKKKFNIEFDHYLIDDVKFYNIYDREDWIDQSKGNLFSPEVAFWSQFCRDTWVLNHCEKGSTVLLRGVDKPRVLFEDNTWKLSFLDVSSHTLHDPWTKTHDTLYHDFFYWTDDMPQVVCKQAHAIKNFFSSWDHTSKDFLEIFSRDKNRYDRKKYVEWIDPIIYGPYLSEKPGESRKYFSLGKSPWQNYWRKDDAFFVNASQQQLSNWKFGVEQMASMVPSRFYNSPETTSVQQFIEAGLVGIWSQEFIIGEKNV